MDYLVLTKNDRLPTLYGQAEDFEREIPWNLSGATVTLKVREVGGTTVLVTASGTIIADQTGFFHIEWAADDLDLDVGTYEGELSITITGKTETAKIHYWDGFRYDTARKLPIRVIGEY